MFLGSIYQIYSDNYLHSLSFLVSSLLLNKIPPILANIKFFFFLKKASIHLSTLLYSNLVPSNQPTPHHLTLLNYAEQFTLFVVSYKKKIRKIVCSVTEEKKKIKYQMPYIPLIQSHKLKRPGERIK